MARPLGSTLSADRGAPPSLFERFSATISLSDFPPPCIAVVLLSDSQRGPWGHPPGVRGGISRLPCKQLPYVHRVSGPRGGGIVLAISERFHVAFRSYDYVGPPKSFSFRGSIPGPHVPLSMLRLHSYECRRMTRGQHGSLLLSCERLSLSATHRFAPAHRKVKILCAVQRRRFPVGAIPTRRRVVPAGSSRSGGGGNKSVEASDETDRLGRFSEHAGRNVSER